MNQSVIQIPPTVSHQYLVEGRSGYLLIDTGLSNNYTHIVNFLRKEKINLGSIEICVITHADGDHYGSLAALQAILPNLTTAASQIEAEAIRTGKASRPLTPSGIQKTAYNLISPLFKVSPARVDRILKAGEELPYLGGLEILDTPGHTPGHISLWSSSTRTLFCGDSIRIRGKNLSPSSGANTWDETEALTSFNEQIALEPDRMYAGHGIWQRE